VEEQVQQPQIESPNHSSLPSIGDLLKESWETFKKSALNLFIFNIIALVGYVVIGVLSFGIILASGIFAITNQIPRLQTGQAPDFSQINPIFILVGIVVLVIGTLTISTVQSIGSVLIIDKRGEEISFGDIIKKSFGLIIPVSIVGLLVFLLTFGGFFVFILPAILFQLFFIFSSYNVILDGKRTTGSLKNSYAIVKKHFGEILVRLLILFAINITITIFIPNTITRIGPGTGIILVFLSILINVFLGWFSLAYITTLYKQARVGMIEQKSSILWTWIIAVTGWIIFGFVVFAVTKTLTSSIFNEQLMKEFNKANKANQGIIEKNIDYNINSEFEKELNKSLNNNEIFYQKENSESTETF